MAEHLSSRPLPEGHLPLLSCEGTAFECGVMLGCAWREVLHLEASRFTSEKPWWKDRRFQQPISRYAPHLPDLFRGMAEGSGLKEDQISWRAPAEDGACTSFAVAPEATLDGVPISGQTKDVSVRRGLQLLVLRMKIKEGPSVLTLTYPGWLFGHGFVRGGTAIFRNSLYVEERERGIPYDMWGLLALHCPTVEEVIEFTRRYSVRSAFHCTVADERGGIIGIENGRAGPKFLRPKNGIYAHANCIISSKAMLRYEKENESFTRKDSLHRTARLRERLDADRGRLTAQLAYAALCDHDGYPISLCRHESAQACTASAVIVEPTRGRLYATRGLPCQNWPKMYAL